MDRKSRYNISKEDKEEFRLLREKYSPENEVTKEVLEALSGGSHEAFRMVYLQFANSLVNFIERLTRSKSIAEDLTQEIFAGVWEKRKTINIHTSIKGYLFTVARNTSIDYFRNKRNLDISADEWVYPEDIKDSANPDDYIIMKETELLIKLVVGTMPKQRRRIFELSNYEGLSNEAIAKQLNISKTAVEKQISYARRELREVIKLFFILFISSQ